MQTWEIVQRVRNVLGCAEECDPRYISFDLSPFVQLTCVGTIVSTSKGTIFRDVVTAYNASIPPGSRFGTLEGMWFPEQMQWQFRRKDFFLANLIAVKCFHEKETVVFPEKTIQQTEKVSKETQKNADEGAEKIDAEVQIQKQRENEFKAMLKRQREIIKRHRES